MSVSNGVIVCDVPWRLSRNSAFEFLNKCEMFWPGSHPGLCGLAALSLCTKRQSCAVVYLSMHEQCEAIQHSLWFEPTSVYSAALLENIEFNFN